MPTPQRDHLVFTSAGDNNNIAQWQDGRNFDLWVAYYGNKPGLDENINPDFCINRKGGKVQNFHYIYTQYRDVLAQYKSIILADDDIKITPSQISYLFKLRSKYSLTSLQPSLDPRGKNSYPSTTVKPFKKMRYCNFNEITFVCFETQFLLEFMEMYSPKVNCWGVDWWYSSIIDERFGKNSMAIVDAVCCENPPDEAKGNHREIEYLNSEQELADNWEAFNEEQQLGIKPVRLQTHKSIPTFNPILICRQLFIRGLFNISRLKNILRPPHAN